MTGEKSLRVRVALTRPGGAFALHVDFEVPAGITVLFGPSGSGKSTTLAAIAGLEVPQAGHVSLGQDVWFDSDAGRWLPVHQRRVGVVLQDLALFPHLSCASNVAYGVSRTLTRAERRQRAMDALERLEVGHCAARRPATLSGGEAQRVALARAVAMAPTVLLLDEPFSALERRLSLELAADLREIVRAAKIPVLYVTHDRGEARRLADRVVLLEAGRIVASGGLELLAEPESETLAGGASPPRVVPGL